MITRRIRHLPVPSASVDVDDDATRITYGAAPLRHSLEFFGEFFYDSMAPLAA